MGSYPVHDMTTCSWTLRLYITGLAKVTFEDVTCSPQQKTSMSFYFCKDYDVGLYVYPYFKLYHTKFHS